MPNVHNCANCEGCRDFIRGLRMKVVQLEDAKFWANNDLTIAELKILDLENQLKASRVSYEDREPILSLTQSWLKQIAGSPISVDPETLNVTILSIDGCKHLLDQAALVLSK